jgi:hypothetical protein
MHGTRRAILRLACRTHGPVLQNISSMTATIANTAYPTPPTSTPSPSSPTEGSPWHNGSRAFLTASVPDLVSRLTKYEKIKLLAGADWWHTVPIHRLNIPGIKVSPSLGKKKRPADGSADDGWSKRSTRSELRGDE